MSDTEEIIEYLKSLKRGFDKELFQSKLNELGHIVDTEGLDYEDFHVLFKVWLNLSIPITKWANIGICVVPQEIVRKQTVEYSLRWLLANFQNHSNFSRIAFLLDWLTAAMNSDSIDLKALDVGYEVFYTMLSFEALTAHALKLVYTLTKPSDVTRRRVLELLDCAKRRESKKTMLRQLQVLLGLFKSYKPEFVPEDIPGISVHTSFRKINQTLDARFKRNRGCRNGVSSDKYQLLWTNPYGFEHSRSKKVEPLLPNMEYVNIGSKQYAEQETKKNHLDFTDAGAGAGGVAAGGHARALLTPSAAAIDKLARLMLLYKKIYKSSKIERNGEYLELIELLKGYTSDMLRCLYSEEAISERHTGVMFDKLHPQLLEKIKTSLPEADSTWSIRNSLAFAPYTYLQVENIDYRDATNDFWFNAVIDHEFDYLSKFLKKALRI